MGKDVGLSASILAADTTQLNQEIQDVIAAGIDSIHIDIMDGCFVPSTGFDPEIVGKIRSYTNIDLHAHLMVQDPLQYTDNLARHGANLVSFHVEAAKDPLKVINHIKSLGIKVGLAIKPETKAADIKDYLPFIDQVLVMGVTPGFAGQSFIPSVLSKISDIKNILAENGINIDIAVDGGVSPATAKSIVMNGATVLVAGTAIFSEKDKCYDKAISAFLCAIDDV